MTTKTIDFSQFTGDDMRYRTLNGHVIYTPGIRHLAEQAQAYWLIDAIASYFGSPVMKAAMRKDGRLKDMQFWRLQVSDGAAKLTAVADSGEEPFIVQDIEYTDFPLKEIVIWAEYDGRGWTLLLPQEH